MKTIQELSVLIVDDHGFMLKAISTCLRKLGIESIYQAHHGREGLAVLDNHSVDVIISDLEMEPINGLEFIKTIRMGKSKASTDIPIIVLTGHAERPLVEEAVLLDPSGFAVKPINVKDLQQKLSFAIDPKSQFIKHSEYSAVQTDFEAIIENYEKKSETQIESETLEVLDLNPMIDKALGELEDEVDQGGGNEKDQKKEVGPQSTKKVDNQIDPSSEADREQKITFLDLKQGMILSRELVFDDHGEPVILKKGMEITQGTIDYLSEFVGEHGNRHVFIKV